MDDRPDMRASDAERQDVVERLRAGLDDGRLKMDEYVERMGRAYDAVTRGDLVPLCRDLPETATPAPARPAAPAPAPVPVPAPVPAPDHRGVFARQPVALKVLWTIWLVAVSVNVVVWVLVSGTSGHLQYPWPLWVAGPYGAALLAISAAAAQFRRGPGPDGPPPLPPGQS
jgi:Domain of unknown function (DUF1707)